MYMYFRDTRIDALVAHDVVVSFPFANKVRFSSVLRGCKDCARTIGAPPALVIGCEPNASSSI
jgi:hypothetical protein